MHQSLSLSVFGGTLNLAQSLSQSLSSSTASKDDRKSQGWDSASSRLEGVNAKNVNEPDPLHFTYIM